MWFHYDKCNAHLWSILEWQITSMSLSSLQTLFFLNRISKEYTHTVSLPLPSDTVRESQALPLQNCETYFPVPDSRSEWFLKGHLWYQDWDSLSPKGTKLCSNFEMSKRGLYICSALCTNPGCEHLPTQPSFAWICHSYPFPLPLLVHIIKIW